MASFDPKYARRTVRKARRLTCPELWHAGALRFGPGWAEPMALQLDVSIRTMRRWKSGVIQIGPGAGERLVDSLERDGRRMIEAAATLRRSLGMQDGGGDE
jgi:hypothetical protein